MKYDLAYRFDSLFYYFNAFQKFVLVLALPKLNINWYKKQYEIFHVPLPLKYDSQHISGFNMPPLVTKCKCNQSLHASDFATYDKS